MPEGAFSSYSPQEQVAKAREWLQQQGLPMNADNLNRAMMALHNMPDRGGAAPATASSMDRAITRSMADAPNRPRSARPAMPVAAEQLAAEPPAAAVVPQTPVAAAELSEGDPADGDIPMPPPAAPRRRGTINAAQVIDEENPNAGFETGPYGTPEGQQQIASVLAALLGITPVVGAAQRGLGVTLNRPMLTRPTQRMGGDGMTVTRMPEQIAGPGNMPRLPPPSDSAGALSAPSTPPMLPGSGGAAAQVPRLPAPEAPVAATAKPRGGNPILRAGPRRRQQGTDPPQNTYRGQSPRAGEERPRGASSLREHLMTRRAAESARRAARTGRD